MGKTKKYFQGVVKEGKRVRWPNRETILKSLGVVLVITIVVALWLSLDDYIVTEFTRGPGLLSGEAAIETLSTYIQTSLKKHAVPAELRPLTLVIFLTVLLLVVGISLYKAYKPKAKSRREVFNNEKTAL